MFKKTYRQALCAWLIIFPMALLSGCASLPGANLEAVGQRQIEFRLTRQGPPIVVFENGLGATLDWWAKVVPALEADTTVLTYNRAGYGRSGPVDTIRDGQHVVQELRELLRERGLSPPYVLVGHSLGGLYMQWFARRYPQEVQALVLVDSTHPAQMQGQGAPENWPTWVRVAFNAFNNDTSKAEFKAIDATGQSVLSMPSYTSGPVEVLSALVPMQDRSTPMAEHANQLRSDLVHLYPGARQVWVDSSHAMPLEAPEAVVSAIRRVLQHKP
ncbi:alpha/beta hydrolase [Polaromonas sp.]|uniref:alpha/beta fold hydrolase n=1 Tax=Polaromonas sp. TaxID=1869339 RepID=UPI00248911C2|nr:alpha/beta hydrolase [Polaromonas sp.]MDI1342229.1 alpha/beta hydrolase [Polaromonas sp.]